MAESRVQVSSEFEPFVEAAILRFGYLFSSVQISRTGNDLVIVADDENNAFEAAKQLRYTLYRESIAARSADLRLTIAKALFDG